jgi:hypothetical protein
MLRIAYMSDSYDILEIFTLDRQFLGFGAWSKDQVVVGV